MRNPDAIFAACAQVRARCFRSARWNAAAALHGASRLQSRPVRVQHAPTRHSAIGCGGIMSQATSSTTPALSKEQNAAAASIDTARKKAKKANKKLRLSALKREPETQALMQPDKEKRQRSFAHADLECIVCKEFPSGKIFQCQNGHLLCTVSHRVAFVRSFPPHLTLSLSSSRRATIASLSRRIRCVHRVDSIYRESVGQGIDLPSRCCRQ